VLIAELVHEFQYVFPGFTSNYPALKAIHDAVIAMPSVAAYLQSDRRFPFPEGEECEKYKKNVDTVLGR
jgi:glutathione S-transferase